MYFTRPGRGSRPIRSRSGFLFPDVRLDQIGLIRFNYTVRLTTNGPIISTIQMSFILASNLEEWAPFSITRRHILPLSVLHLTRPHPVPPGPTRPHRDQPLWIDSSRFNPFKQQSNLSDRSLQANANATRLPRHSSDGAVATFWFIPPSPGSPGSPGSVESVGSPGLSCLPVSKRQSASRWEWQYSVGYRCRARFSTHPRDAPRRPPSGNLPFRFDCNTAATESYKLLPIISTVILLLLFHHHHHHYYHLLFLLPLSYFFFSFTASLASLYSSFFSFSSSSSSSSSFFFP